MGSSAELGPVSRPSSPPSHGGPRPAWPERLCALARLLRTVRLQAGETPYLAELWTLLNLVLGQHIRAQSRRLGRLTEEDVADIASEKALDLVRRIDCGKWRPAEATPAEVVRFVSAVARNGVVDFLRKEGSRREASRQILHRMETNPQRNGAGHPALRMESRRFAEELVKCFQRLDPRQGLVWYLRVFHDMSSKRIASHAEVQLKPGHVDVILHRARKRIRACMESKGYQTSDAPPGAFVEIWAAFRMQTKEDEPLD